MLCWADMIVLGLLIVFSHVICEPLLESHDEARLIHTLLNRKRKQEKLALNVVRPVRNSSTAVKVEFLLFLSQIAFMDEERQSMTVHVWEQIGWTDEFMTWKPEEYGGLTSINVPKRAVWRPDLVPYKVLDAKDPMATEETTTIIVNYTGSMMYVPQKIYDLACDVNVNLFPLDIHSCNLTYGSSAYPEAKMNAIFATDDGFGPEVFVENQQWHLLNVTSEMQRNTYDCCEGTYVLMHYVITIQRQVAFFAFVLLLPAVLLSLLTLVGFCLPPDHPEKITIGLSIFLSYFVLLLIVVDSSPSVGTSIPVVGQYFSVSLILIALSVFCTALVCNIKDRGVWGVTFPKSWKGCLVGISSCFGLRYYLDTKSPTGRYRLNPSMIGRTENHELSALELSPDGTNHKNSLYGGHKDHGGFETDEDDVYENLVMWFQFARILDRLFLLVYIIINIIAGGVIFIPWYRMTRTSGDPFL